MPESIRTYANRCRGCLEKFFDNEKISPLTSFIVLQFESFTSLTVNLTHKTMITHTLSLVEFVFVSKKTSQPV